MTKNTTRAMILTACLKLAVKCGYRSLTRDAIAEAVPCSPSLISYHLGTMIELRRHVMREAVRTECLAVVAQGLAARDKHANKAPAELREAALVSLRRE